MPLFMLRPGVVKTTAMLFVAPLLLFANNNGDQSLESNPARKVTKQPQAIRQAPPRYPYNQARAGLSGRVLLSFVINDEGRVVDIAVTAANNPAFERPAIEAIKKWRFRPGESEGRPVSVRVSQLIDFELDESGRWSETWQVSKGKDHAERPPEFRWDIPPKPVLTMFPVYPFAQLQAGRKGKVKLAFVVGPGGRVVSAELLEATVPEFGAAVLAMIDAWEFEPARKQDGTPCYVSLGSDYDFDPAGRGHVPVVKEAMDILQSLKKNAGEIVPAAELDEPLQPFSQRPPAYPSALAREGMAGEAVIEFFVDRNGDAQLPKIVSSTAPAFGYAAAQAVSTWRFRAPMKNRNPVVVRVLIPIEFSLPPAGGQKP